MDTKNILIAILRIATFGAVCAFVTHRLGYRIYFKDYPWMAVFAFFGIATFIQTGKGALYLYSRLTNREGPSAPAPALIAIYLLGVLPLFYAANEFGRVSQ